MEFRPRHAEPKRDKIAIWQREEPVFLGGEGAKPYSQESGLALVRFVRTALPTTTKPMEFALARFAVSAASVGVLAMRKRQILDGIKSVGAEEFVGLHTASENVVVRQNGEDLHIAPEIVDFTSILMQGACGWLTLQRDFVGNQRLVLLDQHTGFTNMPLRVRHTTGESATMRGYQYLSRPISLGKNDNCVVLSDRNRRCALISLRGAAGMLSARLEKEFGFGFAPMGVRGGVGGREIYGYSWNQFGGKLECRWTNMAHDRFVRQVAEAEPVFAEPNDNVVPG